MNWNALNAWNNSLILEELRNLPDALEERAYERQSAAKFEEQIQELKTDIFQYQKELPELAFSSIAEQIGGPDAKKSIENFESLCSLVVENDCEEDLRPFAVVAMWAAWCADSEEKQLSYSKLISLFSALLKEECYKKPCDDTGVFRDRIECMAKHENMTVKMHEAIEDVDTRYPLDLFGTEFIVFESQESLRLAMLIWYIFSPGVRLETTDERCEKIANRLIWDLGEYTKPSQEVQRYICGKILTASVNGLSGQRFNELVFPERAEADIIERSLIAACKAGLLEGNYWMYVAESKRSLIPGKVSVHLNGKKIALVPLVE